MEVYFRRYFWVVGAVVIVACAVFAAKGVNNFVEAKYMPDKKEAKQVRKVASARGINTAKAKQGEPLAKRNMFCSECVLVEESKATGPIVDSDAPPITSLPLRLVATNVSTVEEGSFGDHPEHRVGQDRFVLDQEPDPRGRRGRADQRQVRRLQEQVEPPGRAHLAARRRSGAQGRQAQADQDPPAEQAPAKMRDELRAAIEAGVKKSGDNAWEIDRAVVDKVLANPTAVGRGARIVPSIKNGKPNGFKLYAIRPSSVYAKIGLMNGDTLHTRSTASS